MLVVGQPRPTWRGAGTVHAWSRRDAERQVATELKLYGKSYMDNCLLKATSLPNMRRMGIPTTIPPVYTSVLVTSVLVSCASGLPSFLSLASRWSACLILSMAPFLSGEWLCPPYFSLCTLPSPPRPV